MYPTEASYNLRVFHDAEAGRALARHRYLQQQRRESIQENDVGFAILIVVGILGGAALVDKFGV